MTRKIYHLILSCLVLNGCEMSEEPLRIEGCGSPCQQVRPHQYTADSLLSAYAASASARDLPTDDLLLAATIAQNLFESGNYGQTAYWHSDNTANHGEIILLQPVADAYTQCLIYQQRITINHQRAIISEGKACRETYGGIWTIVEEKPNWIR